MVSGSTQDIGLRKLAIQEKDYHEHVEAATAKRWDVSLVGLNVSIVKKHSWNVYSEFVSLILVIDSEYPSKLLEKKKPKYSKLLEIKTYTSVASRCPKLQGIVQNQSTQRQRQVGNKSTNIPRRRTKNPMIIW